MFFDLMMRCCPLPLLLDSIQFPTTVHLTHSWSSVFPHGHVSCVTLQHSSPHTSSIHLYLPYKKFTCLVYIKILSWQFCISYSTMLHILNLFIINHQFYMMNIFATNNFSCISMQRNIQNNLTNLYRLLMHK